jgi:outer membrane protein
MRTTAFLHPRLTAAAGVLALACAALTPATLAADVTDIGYLDQAALANVPSFLSASRELQSFKAGLDQQYAEQMRAAHDQAAQARIAAQFQDKLSAKQREVLGPLFARAQVAIASIASSKNLSVVVDKRIVVVGGQDVTKSVVDLLNGPSAPIPPVSTPPPSSVGYVDQTQIDQVPKLKSAAADFDKFRLDQQAKAQQRMKAARTDADRQAVLRDFQKAMADQQKAALDPLVQQTRDAIAAVAKKKGLVLVVDKTNLIYGGTDITSDVVAALK